MVTGWRRNVSAGKRSVGTAMMLSLAIPTTVAAQQAPAPAAAPAIGELDVHKLVWSTMIAVDQANKSGNYSVLRDLAAPGFQASNDPARLTQIFAGLRATNIDLSNTLLLAPTYTARPTMVQPDVLRMQGYFGLRPASVRFELIFQWIAGRWRLFGVSIVPFQMPADQGAPAEAEQGGRAKPKKP